MKIIHFLKKHKYKITQCIQKNSPPLNFSSSEDISSYRYLKHSHPLKVGFVRISAPNKLNHAYIDQTGLRSQNERMNFVRLVSQ
jgi:hypothetical protein